MSRAAALNQNCGCELPGTLIPGFHSRLPVFVEHDQVLAMRELISTIHRVTESQSYQAAVLESSPAIARMTSRLRGVFDGYDFHLSSTGPKLIEINTNAGGAMINAAAEWRHPVCCDESISGLRMPRSRAELEAEFLAMFREEWALARGGAPLRSIAIVDDDPETQFLYPEFQLFAELFAKQGIETFIAEARQLEIWGGVLRWRGQPIDLVYNRVTDFPLDASSHAALKEAWLTDAAVITPHPRAHALRADKRVLTLLSDESFLESIGVSERDRGILSAGIPRTRLVGQGQGQDWWPDRKGWFFKPASGFGSRGAYRGDKITRRAFGEVMRGGYVAQTFVPPSERLRGAESESAFKIDLRNYVYDGRVQLLAARLYQGQTTNFRTSGGGFAAVLQTGA